LSNDQAPVTSSQDVEQVAPSKEASESGSEPAKQKYWGKWLFDAQPWHSCTHLCALEDHIDIGFWYTSSSPFAPTKPGPSKNYVLVRAGWRGSQGELKTAYIGFLLNGTIYLVVFDKPDECHDQDRTVVHVYTDLFIKQEYAKIIDLVLPLMEKEEIMDHPETFESALSRAEVCYKLVPPVEGPRLHSRLIQNSSRSLTRLTGSTYDRWSVITGVIYTSFPMSRTSTSMTCGYTKSLLVRKPCSTKR
jgi:hypothetical protein